MCATDCFNRHVGMWVGSVSARGGTGLLAACSAGTPHVVRRTLVGRGLMVDVVEVGGSARRGRIGVQRPP